MHATEKVHYTSVEAYFASLPEKAVSRMEELRDLIRNLVPEAEELISYNMPAFRYFGILVYYAGYKNHIGFYPADAKLIDLFSEDLAGYKTSKGTIHFPLDRELPRELLERIVRYRKAANEEKASRGKKTGKAR